MIARPRGGASASRSGCGRMSGSSRYGRSAAWVGSSATTISIALLPGEDEAVYALVHDLLEDRIAGRLRPRGEVLDRARVGCPDLDGLARDEGPDDLRRLHDRHGAAEPACIDQGVCHASASGYMK